MNTSRSFTATLPLGLFCQATLTGTITSFSPGNPAGAVEDLAPALALDTTTPSLPPEVAEEDSWDKRLD